MKIRLIKRWNGFKTTCIRDVSEGVANLLIRRGIAVRLEEEPAIETATAQNYTTAGRRSKAGK